MNEYAADYQRRFDTFLQTVASRLEQQIRTYLRDARNLDRITARAKDPERFAEKADRRDAQGRQKYSRPLTEIQDLLGARVVVFYRGDVDRIVETITRYFRPIEQRELVPDSQWAFGYFGQHLILSTPRDVIPEDVKVDEVPRFFELQIKTMFQHAWSEANHDLGYKPDRPLTTDQERLLAYTAAQAWGADRVFDELRVELGR